MDGPGASSTGLSEARPGCRFLCRKRMTAPTAERIAFTDFLAAACAVHFDPPDHRAFDWRLYQMERRKAGSHDERLTSSWVLFSRPGILRTRFQRGAGSHGQCLPVRGFFS